MTLSHEERQTQEQRAPFMQGDDYTPILNPNRKTMKRHVRGKKLEAMLEEILQKRPRGVLVIESEFEIYLTNDNFEYLLPEVVSGRVSNRKVIAGSIAAMKKLVRLAQEDISNIRKCASFVQRKFPHAFFCCGNFSIDIHNLSSEEVQKCLDQKGMKFTYYDN